METIGQIGRMEEIPYRLVFAVLVVAVAVGGVVYLLFGTPLYPRVFEGFVSQNIPKNLRALPEAGELLTWLEKGKKGAVHAELELLLHKMAALVADLTSTDRQVQQTRHLPFETAHDRMVVGEICGMCLQKTLSARDVDLFLEAWRTRGGVLIRKLCTVENLSEAEAERVEQMFSQAWARVHDVATVQCVASLPSEKLGARDARPFEPGPLRNTGSYNVQYDGLSASGWNGQV